jgi:dihydroflavonol-4-reductase
MQTFVTGGTGFVGGALVRRLLEAGHTVRALVRPGTNTCQLDGLAVERIHGDLSDSAALQRGMAGCEWVFHVAALYAYWGYSWEQFYQANVEGTRQVLEIASRTGPQRVIYTSSIATLGTPRKGSQADEETPVKLADKVGLYKRSKFMAEEVARGFARQGLPVVIVNPAAPVGVGDHKPTQTGKMILDFLNGKMPAYVETGLTIVDVEDVAAGHLLAAEKGKIGQRYILGGENLTLKQVMDLLAEITGRAKVRTRIPWVVALAWAYLDTGLAGLDRRHIPAATPDAVQASRKWEFYSSAKAIRELGFTQTPAREALSKAAVWYRQNGYVLHDPKGFARP